MDNGYKNSRLAEIEYMLGQNYENGNGGLPEDTAKAIYWYQEEAADQNYPGAKEAFKRLGKQKRKKL